MDPSWSPDDHRLFFYSARPAIRQIYSIGIDGTDERKLTKRHSIFSCRTSRPMASDSPEHRIGRADFATDGRRLFVTIAADESDVYTMELNR